MLCVYDSLLWAALELQHTQGAESRGACISPQEQGRTSTQVTTCLSCDSATWPRDNLERTNSQACRGAWRGQGGSLCSWVCDAQEPGTTNRGQQGQSQRTQGGGFHTADGRQAGHCQNHGLGANNLHQARRLCASTGERDPARRPSRAQQVLQLLCRGEAPVGTYPRQHRGTGEGLGPQQHSTAEPTQQPRSRRTGWAGRAPKGHPGSHQPEPSMAMAVLAASSCRHPACGWEQIQDPSGSQRNLVPALLLLLLFYSPSPDLFAFKSASKGP